MSGKADTVVTGGKVVTAAGTRLLDVVITDGRIVALEPEGAGQAEAVIDARDLIVVPGAVDMHVHLREPGMTHKEDVASGTRAAACGGVTTVCDMPSTLPPIATVQRFREKIGRISTSCWVDVGLWAGGTDLAELKMMHADGAVGVKVYMVSGPGFEELYTEDDGTLTRVLGTAAQLDWLACAHVGDEQMLERHRAELVASGRCDAWAFLEVQRGPSSLSGLRRFLDAARHTGCAAHVAHLSVFGVEALEELRKYRHDGVLVTAETQLPVLGTADVNRLGIFALASGQDDNSADVFWDCLASGEIEVSATDHGPHTREEKAPGIDDVWAAPAGYPAVETALPLAFDAVLAGRWPLERMVDAMARRPAELLGLPHKGEVTPGRDADLVLLDPSATWQVDEARLHSKAGWSPFHGRVLRGRVRATVLRGQVIARDGEIVAAEPVGRVLRRDPSHAQAAQA